LPQLTQLCWVNRTGRRRSVGQAVVLGDAHPRARHDLEMPNLRDLGSRLISPTSTATTSRRNSIGYGAGKVLFLSARKNRHIRASILTPAGKVSVNGPSTSTHVGCLVVHIVTASMPRRHWTPGTVGGGLHDTAEHEVVEHSSECCCQITYKTLAHGTWLGSSSLLMSDGSVDTSI
jgi:hypothetical protein